MANQIEYAYEVKLTYSEKNYVKDILSESIRSVVIRYDYFNENMPIIFVSLNIPIGLYNRMILNYKTGKVLLNMKCKERNNTGSSMLNTISINGEFDYYFSDEKIEYNIDDITVDEHNDNTTRSAVIGLISSDLVNLNRRMINNIYVNSTRGAIIYNELVHGHTGSRKLIIEPFDNNSPLERVIIPPISSLSKFVNYMDDHYSLYNTEHLFFMDFDATYLISTAGTKFNISGKGYPSLKIDFVKTSEKVKSNIEGIVEDTKNKIYTMAINVEDSNINLNKVADKRFNKLVMLDCEGTQKSAKLDINPMDGSSEKIKVIRGYKGSLDNIYSIKNGIESSAIPITFTKRFINNQLLTPFRQIEVTNTDIYKQYNGRYILTDKTEFYMNSGNNTFNSSVLAKIRKIK